MTSYAYDQPEAAIRDDERRRLKHAIECERCSKRILADAAIGQWVAFAEAETDLWEMALMLLKEANKALEVASQLSGMADELETLRILDKEGIAVNVQLNKLSNPLVSAIESFKVVDELVMQQHATLPDAIRIAFAGALSDVARNVDLLIASDRECDEDLTKLDAMLEFLHERRAYIESRKVELREAAKEAVESMEDRGTLRGALGTIYTVRSASVDPAWGSKKLTQGDIDFHGIPDEYVRVKTLLELNADAVGKALKAGDTFAWASLKERTSLAIRPSKKGQDA